MRLSPYPTTKHGGVPSFGDLPEGWECRRLKFAASCNDEALSETTDPDYELAYVDISSVDLINGITAVETMTFEEAPSRARRIVRDGDTIVSTVRTYLKAIAPIEDPSANMIVSTGFAVLRPLNFIDRRFLGYALQGSGFIDDVVTHSTGVSYPAIAPTTLVCLQVCYPEAKEEQRQIAAFLDRKTGQIDALLTKKRALLEKLQEKRLAVITQAVTRGLNPAAPLKDSGIPWLGKVPAHWDVLQLRRRWTIRDCKHKTVSFVNEGIPLASIREVHAFEVNLEGAHKTTEDEFLELIEGDRQPQIGDIIYSRNASVGDASIVTTSERFCMGQDVCLMRSADSFPRFVAYLLRSHPLREQAAALMIGSTFNRINVGQIKAFWVAVPPIEEQAAIARFLDEQTARVDLMAGKVETAIARLTEYRTAIITAATTGKVDVRKKIQT